MTLQFTIGGQVLDADALRQSAPRQKRPKAEAPQAFHRGFRVEGHPPGALEAARESAIKAFDEWHAQTSIEQAKRIKAGERPPKEWSEILWRAKTKPRPVRSKPYELAQAAEQCKAMAERAGWLDVQITAISKGEAKESA